MYLLIYIAPHSTGTNMSTFLFQDSRKYLLLQLSKMVNER